MHFFLMFEFVLFSFSCYVEPDYHTGQLGCGLGPTADEGLKMSKVI